MDDNRDVVPPENDEAEAARRDTLARLGVMGTYVAPAMMVLLSSKASGQTVTSGGTG